MAKARVLKVINYREEDIPALTELEETLKREGKEFSEWAREQTVKYVKAHGKGNPVYPLDAFADNPQLLALPTIYEDPDKDAINRLEAEDIEFIFGQMQKWHPLLQERKKVLKRK